jgi:hypothetical protein
MHNKMKTDDPNFMMGAKIAMILTGNGDVSAISLLAKEAALQRVEAAPYHKELCKIACAAFEADNAENTVAGCLFRNLSRVDEWNTGYNMFTDSVRNALSKQAGMLPVVATLHDKTGGGVMKTLAAGGVLGGATIGSLAFLLSRNARQTSAKNKELLEKVRAYRQLRRDIEEDLGLEAGESSELAEDNTDQRYEV